jgi:phenylalanyl-tRNA synthetase beta chain
MRGDGAGAGVDEHRSIAFVASGAAAAANVHRKSEPLTFFHLKGDIEQLLGAFDLCACDGTEELKIAAAGESSHAGAECAREQCGITFDRGVPVWLHPGRAARAQVAGRTVAIYGQLHPDIAAARKLKQEVWIAELFVEALYQFALHQPVYTPVSKYPAVERDFSFVLPEGVEFDRIRNALAKLEIGELTAIVPAETFRGGSLAAGTYSMLLRVRFQSAERTLRDDEVAAWSQQIIEAVGSLGGTLRQ